MKMTMNYQYLVGQSVKGFVNSKITSVTEDGQLKIQHEIKGQMAVSYVDLSEVEVDLYRINS
jgi:hypothetical protein